MGIFQMSITAGLLIIAIVIIRAVALNKLPKKMFLVLWGVAVFRLLVPVSIPLPVSVIENPINTSTAFTTVMSTTEAAETTHIISIAPITIIWLCGMLAAFIFFAVMYFINHRELRFAVRIRDNDYLRKWLAAHKTKRALCILQSDKITTPIAVGFIKPRIILPVSMDMNDTQLLDYVLAHEYYHIKRFDALWKLLFAFALCVHWFNPFVWVMFVLVNRDLELSCDEMVINRFGAETKTAYAYTLIGLAEQRSKLNLYNSFSKNAVEERIRAVMVIKKTSLFRIISACLLVSVLTFGALAAFASGKPHIEIEWWTYAEYQAYLETERRNYEETDYAWSDDYLRHMERELEKIENGGKRARTVWVDGTEFSEYSGVLFAFPENVIYCGISIGGYNYEPFSGRFYSADDFLRAFRAFLDEQASKGIISQSEADFEYAVWEAANTL